MQEKRVPLRKCIACGEKKKKADLIRIVLEPSEGLVIDPTGKKNGRGAYLCRTEECIRKAEKKNSLKHALNTNIPKEFYEEIVLYVNEK